MVVVRHQSSLKLVLVDFLMGFQFNQVDDSTKTRCLIVLQTKYSPHREHIHCVFQGDYKVQYPRSCCDIQEYIDTKTQSLQMT